MFTPPERFSVCTFFFVDYILSHFLKLHSGGIDGVENMSCVLASTDLSFLYYLSEIGDLMAFPPT
jgi:hypothetical protein